jgi:hypothetical protein
MNGIELLVDLPARRWIGSIAIEARALADHASSRRAVAFFMPRDRSRPPRPWFADVRPDGRFTLTIDTRELVELGPADFALALVAADGSWHSDIRVPIVFRATPPTS